MNEHSAKPHPLDHVVLPVVNIDLARERLGKLGFTVAADARHPFGTENACVFFADKTYLEPLGIANVEESEASARQGNVFTARNQAFRFRCGEEGLSGWLSAARMPASTIRISSATDRALARCCNSPGR